MIQYLPVVLFAIILVIVVIMINLQQLLDCQYWQVLIAPYFKVVIQSPPHVQIINPFKSILHTDEGTRSRDSKYDFLTPAESSFVNNNN